eukprot:667895_1
MVVVFTLVFVLMSTTLQCTDNFICNDMTGLVAYYLFNNNAMDGTSNGYHGFAHNVISTTDRFGNEESAYYFDGTAYIALDPLIPIHKSFSITLSVYNEQQWVNKDPVLDLWRDWRLCGETGQTADGSASWLSGGGIVFGFLDLSTEGNDRKGIGYTTTHTERWWHFGITYDHQLHQTSFYLDGTLVGIDTLNVRNLNGDAIWIGRKHDSHGSYFSGTIDDIFIYNRTLNMIEIQQFYNLSHVLQCEPTDETTTELSTKYIDGNLSCSNLHENMIITYDKELSECIELCTNRDGCVLFNYFENFKEINDSRCYIFDTLCDISSDTKRNSVIGYVSDKECINYPGDWTDNTGDDCDYYETYNWCQNKTLLRNEDTFIHLTDYRYGLTAIDSCCACGGGVYVMDDVTFSIESWVDVVEDDISCSWEYTLQNDFRSWGNIILYDLCSELPGVNCNMLIDTQFNGNDYDYSMYWCDHAWMNQTDDDIVFVFNTVINHETGTYDLFINTLWFNLDEDYYSSNINIVRSNYFNCIRNIMDLSSINHTTSHGIYPCSIVTTYEHTFDPIVSYTTTHDPRDSGEESIAAPSAFQYAIISILSLLLIVCIAGVGLLFRIYKKKDQDTSLRSEIDQLKKKVEMQTPASATTMHKENIYCILCCERKANMFNDPCGHVTYCNKCSPATDDSNCPSCRQHIVEFKQLYNAGFAE